MASKTDKGSWSGERKPHQPRSPEASAAQWLQNAARRFLAEKDPAKSLDEAVQNWLEVRAAAGALPPGGTA